MKHFFIIVSLLALAISSISPVVKTARAQDAEFVPSAEGGDTGGADSTPVVPETEGENIGGGDSNTNPFPIPLTEGAETGGGDSNSNPLSAPPTEGENIGGGDSNTNPFIVPPVEGGQTGGGDTNANANPLPETEGDNAGGGDSAPAEETAIIAPTQSVTTGSSRRTSSSNGGNSNNSSIGNFENAITDTSVLSCNILTTPLRKGARGTEVKALQELLNKLDSAGITVTSLFDDATENAVKDFQVRHGDEILAPWGVYEATGFVSITTRKKLNELNCAEIFPLTASQEALIVRYRNSLNAQNIVTPDDEQIEEPIDMPQSEEIIESESIEVGALPTPNENTNADQTAGAANASAGFFSKILGFFKNLF